MITPPPQRLKCTSVCIFVANFDDFFFKRLFTYIELFQFCKHTCISLLIFIQSLDFSSKSASLHLYSFRIDNLSSPQISHVHGYSVYFSSKVLCNLLEKSGFLEWRLRVSVKFATLHWAYNPIR